MKGYSTIKITLGQSKLRKVTGSAAPHDQRTQGHHVVDPDCERSVAEPLGSQSNRQQGCKELSDRDLCLPLYTHLEEGVRQLANSTPRGYPGTKHNQAILAREPSLGRSVHDASEMTAALDGGPRNKTTRQGAIAMSARSH